jgi:uncharacterized coiled-coil protein SlyX
MATILPTERSTVADDEGTTGSGSSGGPFFDFIAQLRRMTDQFDVTKGGLGVPMPTLPAVPATPSMPGGLPMLPAPGALSAAQLAAMTSAVAAQRGSIEGLQAQLRAFDEQLEVLEQILVPLAEWTRTWAEMERKMMPPGSTG